MLQKIIHRNHRFFLEYNRFRQVAFLEQSPKDAECILYLLPWLVSVNAPECPGYIAGLKQSFRVFGVDRNREIRKREAGFKRLFGVKSRESLLMGGNALYNIHGLYTIGSIGTISQTSSSDCDIWLCYDKREFDAVMWRQLNEKINLIKDWLDSQIKIPVFFFLSDVTDIREGRFGSLDAESSGSVQRNILKEEFYRTCIVICGKTPFWWVCHDSENEVSYRDAWQEIDQSVYGAYEFVDFGDLKQVDKSEYLGAALWQLHKSLTRPLKSIIKMTLLKIQLEDPANQLICHRLRSRVLNGKQLDPMAVTLEEICRYYELNDRADSLAFIKECFFLRCEMNPYERRRGYCRQATVDFLKKFPIDRDRQNLLYHYAKWDITSQMQLGNRLLTHLFEIYKEISRRHTGRATHADLQDLTVLGRKIAACYQKKNGKINVFSKPSAVLNLLDVSFSLDSPVWRVFSGSDKSNHLVASRNIIVAIAFIVWNGFFVPGRMRMEPNPSSVTLQEIINLGMKMWDFFGICDVFETDAVNYLEKEYVVKLLVVISFEKNPWEKDINDFGVIYKTSWGELYVKRFASPVELRAFVSPVQKQNPRVEIAYYLQRNCTYFEKIIERTKQLLKISRNRLY